MGACRPHIILSAAVSADGKIATISGDSELSSRRDIVRVHKLRSRVDAVLVGRNTVSADDPLLTVRHARGESPTRIVLASSGRIPVTSRLFQTCHKVPTIIAVSKKISKSRLAQLGRFPVEVVVAGDAEVDLGQLVGILARRGVRTLLVEGGGTVNWSFIKSGMFDEMYLTVSPFLVGGAGAVSLVGGRGFDTVRESARLELVSAKRLGDHIVLHYRRHAGS